MKKPMLAVIICFMAACQNNTKPALSNLWSIYNARHAPQGKDTASGQNQAPPVILTIDVECLDITLDTSGTDKVTVLKNINKNEVTYEEHNSDGEVEIVSKGKTNIITNPGKIDVLVPENCIIICKSMSGNLTINKLSCMSINADAMSGDIKIRNLVAHRAKITAMSGDISFNGTINIGSYELSAMSGNVNIFLDRNSSVQVKLVSENSGVSVDGENTDRNSLSRTLNTGQGRLSARTMSGDIQYYTFLK